MFLFCVLNLFLFFLLLFVWTFNDLMAPCESILTISVTEIVRIVTRYFYNCSNFCFVVFFFFWFFVFVFCIFLECIL